jgi:hypothetical protein
MVSNFQVEFGQDSDGSKTLQTVPVYYGDPSRQASVILKNNSENMLSAVPAMAVYVSALNYDRSRLLNPYYEGTMRIREQVYDATTQQYTGTQDGQYTVSRYMPAPYKLSMKLDIWTSNLDQKWQLIEQITPLFNPGFEIQSTDNYVDWTSLTVAEIVSTTYTNRSIPMASDDVTIDIATLEFEMPIWISTPAKVQKGGVVQQIIANIYDDTGSFSGDIIDIASTSQLRYTPMNYSVVYSGPSGPSTTGYLTLYSTISGDGTEGTPAPWENLINLYGKLVNGTSQVRLTFEYPDGPHELVGTVAFNPTNGTQLLFSPDSQTSPANTLPAVNAIIDPYNVNVQTYLTGISSGTRYLIVNPIGSNDTVTGTAWNGPAGTNLVANANDIIQYNGSYWVVAFDSENNPGIQYITNMNTNSQYEWTGSNWVVAGLGIYRPGSWSLVI